MSNSSSTTSVDGILYLAHGANTMLHAAGFATSIVSALKWQDVNKQIKASEAINTKTVTSGRAASIIGTICSAVGMPVALATSLLNTKRASELMNKKMDKVDKSTDDDMLN